MKFHKLRIAWSVVWGLFAVLLVVLWVRSYYRCDLLRGIATPAGCDIYSDCGRLAFCWFTSPVTREGMIDKWKNNQERSGLIEDNFFSPIASHGFGYHRDDLEVDFFASHWAAALLMLALTAAPWLPWSKRFSLRTLLFGTTLVAVVLGLVVWASRAH
jgi:hypothetical protein